MASGPRQSPDTEDTLWQPYAAAIGPKDQAYYLRQFERLADGGKTRSGWHWSAFFAFSWFLYRKLRGHAIGMFFVITIR